MTQTPSTTITTAESSFTDNLDLETKRDIDAYSYRVEVVETGEELPVVFRHRDLIPTNG